jgi:hypothetical protein
VDELNEPLMTWSTKGVRACGLFLGSRQQIAVGCVRIFDQCGAHLLIGRLRRKINTEDQETLFHTIRNKAPSTTPA